jgi:2-polyprenyl-3-methyl-5-hydroxy-6-metoxy-1,4-benzoquinol methylase
MAEKSQAGSQIFAQKMIDILNYGALNLAMAIGYRTGLYEVLDTVDSPQSATDIAAKAGLSQRYVKEWLGVMVTAGIVEVSLGEDGEDRFHLPKARADFLTRRAGNSNLGVYTQEVPLLTLCAMEAVIQGFATGEGISYQHYPRFQAFMSELANVKHREILVNQFLPCVDNGKLVPRLRKGIKVCDLGCAEGVALLLMARAFPNSEFTGVDLSAEVIHEARLEAKRQAITNVRFITLDAAMLKDHDQFRGFFDYVMAFDAIHDQTQPLEALQGVFSMLAEDGLFSMIDIAARTRLAGNATHPLGPFLYTVSLMHCMPVGLMDGGAGLGMMWGREMATDLLRQAGFQNVEVLEMPFDAFNLHFFCRK